ncbi:hypothetical protein B8W90_14075, partial [Staphylococcus hominis]
GDPRPVQRARHRAWCAPQRGDPCRWAPAAGAAGGGGRQPVLIHPAHAGHRRAHARFRQIDAGLPDAGRGAA